MLSFWDVILCSLVESSSETSVTTRLHHIMSYKMTIVIFTVVKTSDVPIYYGYFIILSCDNISIVFLFFCIFCFLLIAVFSLFSLHLIFKSNMIVRYIISCDSWCIIMHLTLLEGHIPRKTLSTRPFKWMYLLLHGNIMAFFLTASKFACRHGILPCVIFCCLYKMRKHSKQPRITKHV